MRASYITLVHTVSADITAAHITAVHIVSEDITATHITVAHTDDRGYAPRAYPLARA